MAEVLLLHHVQGLTPGVVAFGDTLRAAGHTVHVPDLFDGATFPSVDEGMAFARTTGFGELTGRGVAAAQGLPDDLVYIGISFGVMAAQQLAQNRPGARAAVLIASCVPPEEFGGPWPEAVPVQVHGKDDDPFFVHEGDIVAARALVASAPHGELFLYPGPEHLFVDSSLPDHDPQAAALLTERVLALLA